MWPAKAGGGRTGGRNHVAGNQKQPLWVPHLYVLRSPAGACGVSDAGSLGRSLVEQKHLYLGNGATSLRGALQSATTVAALRHKCGDAQARTRPEAHGTHTSTRLQGHRTEHAASCRDKCVVINVQSNTYSTGQMLGKLRNSHNVFEGAQFVGTRFVEPRLERLSVYNTLRRARRGLRACMLLQRFIQTLINSPVSQLAVAERTWEQVPGEFPLQGFRSSPSSSPTAILRRLPRQSLSQ